MEINSSRLLVVDALRGFAIISIMLLHNLEHFDFYFFPENLPAWVKATDKVVWDTLFFLFSGKSYAIFAILFGLTFYIQNHRQEQLGRDFRGRFAWRLLLLLGFGLINSALYEGDILTIYAIIGFFLIPFVKLSNKSLLWVAIFLMLQPVEWINVMLAMQNPTAKVSDPLSWSYFGRMGEYITQSSFFDTVVGNLTNGKMAVYIWCWEVGRVFQTLSLFMFGILAGRKLLFVPSAQSKRFWQWTLIISAVLFIPLFYISKHLDVWVVSEAVRRPLSTIVGSISNMAFMMILVSGFVLLYQTATRKVLDVFRPIGQMSLSNYIIQSVLGSFIYYGFGLALYKYTGATYCLTIGIVLAVLQGFFSAWWMKRHKQGPLETLWHKATWIGIEK